MGVLAASTGFYDDMRYSPISLCLLVPIAVTGCGDQHITETTTEVFLEATGDTMSDSFTPAGIESLADIDTADSSYESQCVVIQGVVSPSSQGGWSGENDGYKVHCFSFAAWRRLGEPIVIRDLTILRPVPPDGDYWDDFPKHSIQRISVLLSSEGTRAVFDKALPVDSPGEELQKIANELQKPVVIPTERFGDLVLDRSMSWFEGETQWNGVTIRVTFPEEKDRVPDDALKTAESLWSDQAGWKKRIDEYVVKELLELKNDTWLDEGESELTAAQFIATMELTSISISYDGEFEFWFDDGNLFWGHSIMVSGNLQEGLTDAGIHRSAARLRADLSKQN